MLTKPHLTNSNTDNCSGIMPFYWYWLVILP